MGFFDKVKAAKNALTGGAAKVELECDAITYPEPFKITVRAQTFDAPVTVSRVYLKVTGCEEIEVPDSDRMRDGDGREHELREYVRASTETLTLDITVAEAQQLEPKQTYEWEGTVTLPVDAPSVYQGRYCRHIYRALAGLDCRGNDPDSGWIELRCG